MAATAKGAAGFLGKKEGTECRARMGLSEDLADGFGPVVKIQFRAVRE